MGRGGTGAGAVRTPGASGKASGTAAATGAAADCAWPQAATANPTNINNTVRVIPLQGKSRFRQIMVFPPVAIAFSELV